MNSLLAHTLERPPGLIECITVLDVGAGIRPMAWYKPVRHVCVEPYAPYVEVLRWSGFEVLALTARECMALLGMTGEQFGAVYLLDVIEHMEKDEGQRVLALAQQVATAQVVVYTPDGFKEQTSDVWGYGGHEWQTHRSGWTREDFPGWTVTPHQDALFAVWNA